MIIQSGVNDSLFVMFSGIMINIKVLVGNYIVLSLVMQIQSQINVLFDLQKVKVEVVIGIDVNGVLMFIDK